MKYKFIFLAAFISGCVTSHNPNAGSIDPQDYVLDSVTLCSDCNLTEKMIDQIFLLRTIDEIGFKMTLDLYSFEEVLYNARIFKTKQKEFIINIISLNTKNEQEKNSYKFRYNENGQIIKVDYLANSNYKYEFTYDRNKLLSSCTKYLMTIENTVTRENEVTYHPSKQITQGISYVNENDKVVGYQLTPSEIPHSFSYYKSANDTSILYMKDKSFDLEKVYCFKNGLIEFMIIRKFLLTRSPGAVWKLYTFNHASNTLTIIEYRQAEDASSVLNHFWTFNVEYGPDLRFNRIKRTWGTQIVELYFQYKFIDNYLIGYDIFKAEYDNKQVNRPHEYSLEKSFTHNDNYPQ